MRADRGDFVGGHLAQELAQQERVAAGYLTTGVAEARIGSTTQPIGHERRDRAMAERRRPEDHGERVGGQRVDRLALDGRAGRAGGEGDEHRELVEPGGEELEEAQRAGVGAVGVVDRERGGRLLGEVRGQPVQRVKEAERGVARRLSGGGLGCAAAQQRGGQRGGAVQQLGAPGRSGRCDQRLEELADDAEGEVAVEL